MAKEEPWLTEPDEKNFEEAGLGCRMRRGPSGAWCGYVGVPSGHALYSKSYSTPIIDPPKDLVERKIDIDKVGAINLFCGGRHEEPLDRLCDLVLLLDIHGGLTYSDDHAAACERDGLWWFGFDCAHAGDLSPKYPSFDVDAIYRDEAYAEAECRSLARQLARWPAAHPTSQTTGPTRNDAGEHRGER